MHPISLSFLFKSVANVRSVFRELFQSCWQACTAPRAGQAYRPDAIISNPPVFGNMIYCSVSSLTWQYFFCFSAHVHVAEALGVPLTIAFIMPWVPTGAFPHPFVSDRGWGKPFYNRMTYRLVDTSVWLGMADIINDFRVNTLGLAPVALEAGGLLAYRHEVPHIFCYRSVLPM
jgi:hypothetical protein